MTVPPRAVAAAVCLALLVGGPTTTGAPSPDAKTVPEQPGKQAPLPEYRDVLRGIEQKRLQLSSRYRQADTEGKRAGVVQEARETLLRAIRDEILPQWAGTPWDFNGTTEVPRKGKIACGYFVTTVLRDAGFNLERARLAQLPSEAIIKSLTTEAHIRRFRDTPIGSFRDSVVGWGRGLYLVGLDIHTGFIVNDSDGVFFIHASYAGRKAVVTEAAQQSPILASSKYRVLGNLSADDDLTVKWLLGEAIPTRER